MEHMNDFTGKVLLEGIRLTGKSTLISVARKRFPSLTTLEFRSGWQQLGNEVLLRDLIAQRDFLSRFHGGVVAARGPLSGFADFGLKSQKMSEILAHLSRSGVSVVFLNLSYEKYLHRHHLFASHHIPYSYDEFSAIQDKYEKIAQTNSSIVSSISTDDDDYDRISNEILDLSRR